MKLGVALMMLAMATGARAQEALPPVADVVAHARAVMEKKLPQVVCKFVADTQLLDKTGKPEHDEHREGKATLNGDDQDIQSVSVTRDGRAMTADEIAEEHAKVQKQKAKNKSGDLEFVSPLVGKNATHESFELLRKETLWGRPAFVLKVRAQNASPEQVNGTVWIDAERFVELKGELSPAAMPPHADWIKVQEQFLPGPNDAPLPSLLHIEGAGHMLFLHKQFRTTLRWSDCR